MALDLAGFEAIRTALLEVPAVVDSLDEAGSREGQVLGWMRRIERLLAAKRLPVASTVASFRGTLIGARRGRIPADVELLGKPSRSKLVLATATLVLERSVAEIRKDLAADEERFADAARLAAQLVAVALAKGVAPEDPADALDSVLGWVESASADADLAGGFANLTAAVGRADSITLLAQCLAAVNGT